MKKITTLGQKAQSTVHTSGEEKLDLIEGVQFRPGIRHIDDRGSLTEMWDKRWNIEPEPVSFIYNVTVRPGRIKGWSIHENQVDRLYFVQGVAKVVLYDDREDSPTRGQINELYCGWEKPALVVIPRLVYHAVQNVGQDDVLFVNFPTNAYNHDSPDRYRVPPKNDKIPYDFSQVSTGK